MAKTDKTKSVKSRLKNANAKLKRREAKIAKMEARIAELEAEAKKKKRPPVLWNKLSRILRDNPGTSVLGVRRPICSHAQMRNKCKL